LVAEAPVNAIVLEMLNIQYARFFIPTSKLMIRIACYIHSLELEYNKHYK
jgi:hypothetical protein